MGGGGDFIKCFTLPICVFCFTLAFQNAYAQTFEWTGSNATWEVGQGLVNQNWVEDGTSTYADFSTGGIGNFKGNGNANVILVNQVNTGGINITDGDYTFTGNGFLSGGDLNITGNGTSLILANNAANTYGDTSIGNSSTLTAMRVDSLGTGTIDIGSYGALILDVAVDGIFDNEIRGNWRGRFTKNGVGNVTINNANTSYDDFVTINNGSIILGHNDALGHGSIEVNTNGTLELNGFSPNNAWIDLYGGALINNSTTASAVNDVVFYEDSKIGGSGDLILGDRVYAGGYQGTHNVEKIGSGTTVFTGDDNRSVISKITVREGALQLGNGGAAGSIAGDIVIESGATLIVDRTGNLDNNITGDGLIEIRQDNVSLTGDVDYSKVTIADGGSITNPGLTVGNTETLEVTAVENSNAAAFQYRTLTVKTGGILRTTFTDNYTMAVGKTLKVYIGSNLTDFTNAGTDIYVPNCLYEVVEVDGDKLIYNEEDRTLYYILKRLKSTEVIPDIPPGIGDVIDDPSIGGNKFINNVLNNAGKQEGVALQSAFDIANQTAAISALYHTKQNIGNAIYSRTQIVPGYFGTHYRGQSNNIYTKREAWAAPIYGNSKGFRLNSGNFQYGHVNDQYAMAFGIDTVDNNMRLGIMGLGGWGKARSSGELLTTYNESTFGGLYFYANTRNGNTDYLFTAGYLGMDNDFEQVNLGGNLSGKMSSGLATVSATLTKTYCLGEMHMAPVIGIEYGYYHQGSSDVNWNNTAALHNDKSHANIVVLPIGVNFSAENRLANGAILTPEFRGRYIANVGDVVSSYAVSLPGSSSTALMSTRMSDRHAGDVGVGLGLTRGGTTLRVDYGYMFSQHYRDHYGSAMARWAF